MKPLGWILVVMMMTCFSAKFIHESQNIQDWMWLPKDEYRAKYYMPVQECDRSREFSEYRYACRGPIEHLASSLVNLHDELWRSRRCERHWTNFKVWHSELDSTGRMELRTMTNVFSLKEQLFANDYSSEDADLGLKPFQSEPPSHYKTASCTMTAVKYEPSQPDACGAPAGIVTYECAREGGSLFYWERRVKCCEMVPILEEAITRYDQKILKSYEN